MNLVEANSEMRRLAQLLDDALGFLKRQTREYAEAEAAYRKLKAEAWLTVPAGTVPEREAHVNGATADTRLKRDLADGMRTAALEAVRSRRAQLSALQTLLNAHQEEAKFSRTYDGAA